MLAVKASSITNNYASTYGTQPYSYTFTYPYIWNTYEKTQNNSVNNRSKAYVLTTNTTTASQTCSPYHTVWLNINMNTSSAWVNSNYYSLVMSPAQNATYWLSSRYVYPSENRSCLFSLQSISSNGIIYGKYLYIYYAGSMVNEDAYETVRPIVSFPTSMYRLDTSTTPAKIVKK